MDIQRLRNLTTGILHTEMDHIYQDIEFITGSGFMTHQLPNAVKALNDWLKTNVTDSRFWNSKYEPEHSGEFDLQPMTEQEQLAFFSEFRSLPSPFLESN